jgi:hypothetical protein
MFNIEFTLNKAYFIECYEQSSAYSNLSSLKLPLLILLVLLGLCSIYILNNNYLGTFLISLAILEYVAFYYRKSWWVLRQTLSRASGSKVQLEFNDKNITAVNPYKAFTLNWSDILSVYETPKGLIIKTHKHIQYISNAVINEQIKEFIFQQTKK